ncbi:glycoside hydrolase family 104 protein [Olleya sp. HaHaR_3_96]|uniref:glycoside hydrolase family 24 protein n=1 Tax=Olleya sp. HaHaR_3_96 TaxID=2745560 RepID=UPI001C4EE952|nr:glycoside hydrolase family 104 protein [Olleya sp. HaHaR_3_96]QXP58224.1 hypothetical protein H0I26_09835 [Olleya sp. HaHaR_3_96]
MFWEEASSKTYNPPEPEPEPQATNKNSALDFRGGIVEEPTNLPTSNTPETTETHKTEQTSEKSETSETDVNEQEEKLPRVFPNTPNVYHFHPIAFVNHMIRIYGSGGADNNSEAKIRAFLRVIKEFEGIPGENGYTTLFGGKQFSDMSKHPEDPQKWYTKDDGTIKYSSAAGAYQIMKETWWDYNGHVVKDHKKVGRNENRNFVKKYGIKDFSPKSQDEFCIALLLHGRVLKAGQKGLVNDLLNGYVTRAIETYASHTWASFSPGRYDKQGPTKGLTDKNEIREAIHDARMTQLKVYDKFLAEELAGQSDLHLESGFLKKFGIKEPEPQEQIETKKPGLDLNKVIRGLKRRASDSDRKSLIGRCARYVGFALVDGGLPYAGLNAHKYNSYLVKQGFKEISTTDYQIGDIVVVEAFKWGKKSHPYGHIQMYAGDNQWISDFFQTDFWAGGDYRKATPNYKIYRWE